VRHVGLVPCNLPLFNSPLHPFKLACSQHFKRSLFSLLLSTWADHATSTPHAVAMLSNVLIKTQRRGAKAAINRARRWGSSLASPEAEALHAAPMPLTVLTEEEEMFKDSVARFAAAVIQPSVRSMDEAGEMTPEVIRGLFDNGVRYF
jgi:hypothetical protein